MKPLTGALPAGSMAALRTGRGMPPGNDQPTADEAMETAKKFEALLVHNMLKAMRSTTFAEDGGQDQSMYYDMLDEKLAGIVTENGGMGLADSLARQMQPQASTAASVPGLDRQELKQLRSLLNPATAAAESQATATELPVTTPASLAGTSTLASTDVHESERDTAAAMIDRLRLSKSLWNSIDEPATQPLHEVRKHFIDELTPMATQAAARLGTTPASVLAVAALESDWGRQVISNEAGDSSHNLFGIKAFDDRRPGMWHQTIEYVNGRPEQLPERFRRYADRNASVSDFASFLQQNPRYATALQHAGTPERFIRELHSAGYATDPNYASKVIGVMRQIEALAPATQGSSTS